MIAAACLMLAAPPPMTSTGRLITPTGTMVDTGGFPVSIRLSPDRRRAVVTHSGTQQNLTLLDTATGRVLSRLNFDGLQPEGKSKDGLYFGLRFAASGDGKGEVLLVSHGAADRVDAYRIDQDRLVGPVATYSSPRPFLGGMMPHFLSSAAASSDGSVIYAVGNQSFALSDQQGSLSVFRFGSSKPFKVVPLPGFPLDSVLLTQGPNKDRKLYVGCERDGIVAVVDAASLQVIQKIHVGDTPSHMVLDRRQERLFVTCAGSDSVAVIDTSSDRVIDTIVLRPPEMRGLPGANPLGLDLSQDEKRLYVAMSDLNAIAVANVASGRLEGLIPTGWYPTDVAAGPKGLLAALGKGSQPVQPNLPDDPSDREAMIEGDSGPRIREHLRGQTALIPLPRSLSGPTKKVITNNFLSRPVSLPKKPSGIEHVIYIIKENRTYDQFFGDLPQGNGRPDLAIYGQSVTPNQRALAERFVLLDNFYACAEMSADGWSWSTAGITSSYVQRNAQYDYSGHKREYDYEGQNNGTPADANGLRNVNDPPGGYLWDNALRSGIDFRNYGVYIAQGVPARDRSGKPIAEDNSISMKAFEGRADMSFRMFDLDYAESQAWDIHGASYPKRRESFGGYRSRIEAWKADYSRLIKEGSVPPLMLVRFGNNHTAGTTPGSPTPTAMIADNDYAVGQLVEAVSSGPLWTKTCIVIVEDDAQGGYDHVDGHRSICFVVSPYVKRGIVNSRFYNTDSALRTVEWLLGMKPANQFTLTAHPIDCFASKPDNSEPFKAILQDKSIYKANTDMSYRAEDSARLFHTYREESEADRELADILWGDAKGAKSPRPRVK